jgi:hypothetical protein
VTGLVGLGIAECELKNGIIKSQNIRVENWISEFYLLVLQM